MARCLATATTLNITFPWSNSQKLFWSLILWLRQDTRHKSHGWISRKHSQLPEYSCRTHLGHSAQTDLVSAAVPDQERNGVWAFFMGPPRLTWQARNGEEGQMIVSPWPDNSKPGVRKIKGGNFPLNWRNNNLWPAIVTLLRLTGPEPPRQDVTMIRDTRQGRAEPRLGPGFVFFPIFLFLYFFFFFGLGRRDTEKMPSFSLPPASWAGCQNNIGAVPPPFFSCVACDKRDRLREALGHVTAELSRLSACRRCV